MTYNEIREELKEIDAKVKNIIGELKSTEKYAQFERVYGRSIASNQLYSAENDLHSMIMAINLEIKHQERGML